MANLFRRHNIKTLDAMIPHFGDEERLVSAAKAGREELEAQFAQDRAKFEKAHSGKGWSTASEVAAGSDRTAERQ